MQKEKEKHLWIALFKTKTKFCKIFNQKNRFTVRAKRFLKKQRQNNYIFTEKIKMQTHAKTIKELRSKDALDTAGETDTFPPPMNNKLLLIIFGKIIRLRTAETTTRTNTIPAFIKILSTPSPEK